MLNSKPLEEELRSTNIQDFCDFSYLKFRSFRARLKIANGTYPSYELAQLYYDVSYLWFNIYGKGQNNTDLCNLTKDFLEKCLHVLPAQDESILELTKSANDFLDNINRRIQKAKQEAKNKRSRLRVLNREINKPSLSQETIENNLRVLLDLSEQYLILGNIEKAFSSLELYSKLFILVNDQIKRFGHSFEALYARHQNIQLRANIARQVTYQLKLEEQLMFVDDNNIQIELARYASFEEYQDKIREWKSQESTYANRTSIVRLVNEKLSLRQKEKVLNKSEVYITKRLSSAYVLTYSSNFSYLMNTHITDKVLIILLGQQDFENKICMNIGINTMIERKLKDKVNSYQINKNIKDKLLIAGFQGDESLFIHLQLINGPSSDQNGNPISLFKDVVFKSEKNAQIRQLWHILTAQLDGQLELSSWNLLQNIFKAKSNVFNGLLSSQLPLRRNDQFLINYISLATAYQNLSSNEIASEYIRLATEQRVEISNQQKQSDNAEVDLLKTQIVSDQGIQLPGDHYLRKQINEKDFKKLVIPRLGKIQDLYKGLHPTISLSWYQSVNFDNMDQLLASNKFQDKYQKDSSDIQEQYKGLSSLCYIIYFKEQKEEGNKWGIVLRSPNNQQIVGHIKDLIKINSGFSDIIRLLSMIPNKDLIKGTTYGIEIIQNEKYNILQQNDVSKKVQMFDITNIDGVLDLKTAIRAKRLGYSVILKSFQTFTYFNEWKNDVSIKNWTKPIFVIIPKSEQEEEQYYICQVIKSNQKGIIKIFNKQTIELLKLVNCLNHVQEDQDRVVFASSQENNVLYNIINDAIPDNMFHLTKDSIDSTFTSIITTQRMQRKQHITLCIKLAIRKEPDYQLLQSQDYYVYLCDSQASFNYSDELGFLVQKGTDYTYSFPPDYFIECPQQRASSDDSLVHAYLNLLVLQYMLSERNLKHWKYFQKNYRLQGISSQQNVEVIKKWYCNIDKILDEENRMNSSSVHQKRHLTIQDNFNSMLCQFDSDNKVDYEYNANNQLAQEQQVEEINDHLQLYSFLRQCNNEINAAINEVIEEVLSSALECRQNIMEHSSFKKLLNIFEDNSITKNPTSQKVTLLYIHLHKFINTGKINNNDKDEKQNDNYEELSILTKERFQDYFLQNYSLMKQKVQAFNCLVGSYKQFINAFMKTLFKEYGQLDLQTLYEQTFRNIEQVCLDHIQRRLDEPYPIQLPCYEESSSFSHCKADQTNTFVPLFKRNLPIISALSIAKVFPTHVSNYRMECALNCESFYNVLHELLMKEFSINFQIILTQQVPENIQPDDQQIYIQKTEASGHFSNAKYKIAYFSKCNMKTMFKEGVPLNIRSNDFGYIKLDEDTLKHLLQEINYDNEARARFSQKPLSEQWLEQVSQLPDLQQKMDSLVTLVIKQQKGYIFKVVQSQDSIKRSNYNQGIIYICKAQSGQLKCIFQHTADDELQRVTITKEQYIEFKDEVDNIDPNQKGFSSTFEKFLLEKIKFPSARPQEEDIGFDLCKFIPFINMDHCQIKRLCKAFYDQYVGLFQGVLDMKALLPKLRSSLWNALVDRYDFEQTKDIMQQVKEDMLSNFKGQLEMSELLYQLYGLKPAHFRDVQIDIRALQNKFDQRNDQKTMAACTFLIKNFIIETIGDYLDSLMTYRERLVTSSKLLNTMIYDFLASYELLKQYNQNDSSYKKLHVEFTERTQEIESVHIENNSDLIKSQKYSVILIKVFNAILEKDGGLLQLSQRTQIKDYIYLFHHLKGHSNRFYIENIALNLQKLMNNFIVPCKIDLKSQQEDRTILTVSVESMVLSDLLLKINAKHKLQPGDEVRVITSNKIYLDVDIPELQSVNTVLIGIEYTIPSDKMAFALKTSGDDAANLFGQAQNGQAGYRSNNMNGLDGKDGLSGLPGMHAGNIYVVADKLPMQENAKFYACGGNAGKGQMGGNGGDGARGEDGRSGNWSKKENERYRW